MSGPNVFMIVTAFLRCVSVYCITQAAMRFNNPWLLLIYIAVPMLSYPGVHFAPYKENSSDDVCE